MRPLKYLRLQRVDLSENRSDRLSAVVVLVDRVEGGDVKELRRLEQHLFQAKRARGHILDLGFQEHLVRL